jgi:DNA-binding transcriptional regulator YiaG
MDNQQNPYRITATWSAGSIAKFRRHLGATQREFGDLLACQSTAISCWERAVYSPNKHFRILLTRLAEAKGFFDTREE